MQNCESFKNAFSGVGILGGQIRLYQFQLSGLSLHFLISKIGLMIVSACNEKNPCKCFSTMLSKCSCKCSDCFLLIIHPANIYCWFCVRHCAWHWGYRYERHHLDSQGISSLMTEKRKVSREDSLLDTWGNWHRIIMLNG